MSRVSKALVTNVYIVAIGTSVYHLIHNLHS